MINVNKIGDNITGSYGDKQFGVPYTPELYKSMKELEEAANNAATVKELQEVVAEFEKLTAVDYKTVVENVCENIYVNRATGKFYLKTGNVVSSVELPEALVDRIKASIDKGIDPKPLIKFWTRFLRNPKLRKLDANARKRFSEKVFNYINATYTNHEMAAKLAKEEGVSDDVARARATTYQVKITNEGLMNTFKVSKEVMHKWEYDKDGNKVRVDRYPRQKVLDEITGLETYEDAKMPDTVEERIFEPAVMGQGGDAFFCGDKKGHIIRVGQIHKLESWDQINTNDNQSCVPGLHVGGLDYIRGYQNAGTVTHNVFVDPMHIGAVPDDNTGAIRCVQYFVHSSFAGVNGSIYHSSKYAQETDAEWANMRAEAIKAFGEFKEKHEEIISKETDEINSL